jgi:spermidine synthase/tetratricopeptide (TPR) repeat protein
MTALLAACFFVSGAAGLAYEVLWSRHLALLFGANAEAVGLVLAVFMSGLGLGSRAFGALADRSRSPLRLYAALEAGIGLFALATGPLLAAVSRVFPALAAALGGSSAATAATKAILAAAVLLPPAFLMGGTLPALARALAGERTRAPRVVSLLYAVNLAGAVLGAAATGFWLIERAGLAATMRLAATSDFAVAAVAFLAASRRFQRPSPAVSPAAAPPEPLAPLARAALFVGLFVSGAVFMLDEVVFTRLLSLAFGVSSYSFTLVLALCLLGLGIGGFAASVRAARGPVGLDSFGRVQLGAAALLGLAMAAVPLLSRALVAARQVPGLGFGPTLVVKAVLAAAILVPLASVAGAGMPLLLAFVAGRPGGVGTSVGRAALVNTAGTLAGSLATGFVLVTALGSQATLRLGALGSLAAGLLALAAARGRPGALATVAAGGLALGILVVPRWPDWVFLRSDTFPRMAPAASRLEFEERLRVSNRERLFFEEGRNATVAVLQGPRTRTLLSNGHPEASDTGDMGTQIGVAIVPLVLHRAPREVLVVGFASGVTAAAAARGPFVERVDVAELEDAMFRAGARFSHVNRDVLANPKVRLFHEDARSLVGAARRRWDVILSEPSNLWRAGVSSLFTSDFYASAHVALKPGGLFAQWVQLYGLRWETLRTVLATLTGEFREVQLWWVDGSNVVLVAADAPIVVSRARAEAALASAWGDDPARHLALAEPRLFWARYLGGRDALDALLAGVTRRNTDDRPFVEFEAPRDLFLPDEGNALRLVEAKLERRLFAPPMDGAVPSEGECWAGVARMYEALGLTSLARAAVQRAADEAPSARLALESARLALAEGQRDDARRDVAEARRLGAGEADLAEVEGRLLAAEGRSEDALAAFRRARPEGPGALERLTLLADGAEEDPALEQADRLLAARARGALTGGDAARAVEDLGRVARSKEGATRALAAMDRWIVRDEGVPRIPVFEARAALLLRAGRPAEALAACARAEALSAFDLELMATRAEALRALGRHAEADLAERERARWASQPPPR